MLETNPEQTQTLKNAIITPRDHERFILLDMPSQPCTMPLGQAEQDCIVQMDQVLNELDEEAAGLAAIQIGVPRRIFLLRNAVDENGVTINTAYINPSIISVSKETKKDKEACLSLPGMVARFARPKSVTIEYTDIYGNIQTQVFEGFWARACFHEMDHLNGQLIVRHLEKEIAKQPSRTPFGMKLTPHRLNLIAQRRAKKKQARATKKRARKLGR